MAIQAIGTYKAAAVSPKLVERLRAMTPLVRDEALAVLLARPDRSLALLEAIETKRLPAGLLGLPRKTQLLASTNAQVKARAEAVLGSVDAARGEIVKKYLQSVPDKGDAARGQELFRKHCANCHRAQGMGSTLGHIWKRFATGTKRNCSRTFSTPVASSHPKRWLTRSRLARAPSLVV